MMASMRSLRCFISQILVVATSTLYAQNQPNYGILPRVNLSFNLHPKSKLVFGTESRVRLDGNELNLLLADLNVLYSYRVGLQSKLNGGYLIRFRDGQTLHRLIQQFVIVRKWNVSRLSHRIVTDQTFRSQADAVLRLRYRMALESPLAGEMINKKELYLKLASEVLGILQQRKAELEFRLVPAIGFELNKKNKLELGLDYRVGDFSDSGKRKKDLWMTLSSYFNI